LDVPRTVPGGALVAPPGDGPIGELDVETPCQPGQFRLVVESTPVRSAFSDQTIERAAIQVVELEAQATVAAMVPLQAAGPSTAITSGKGPPLAASLANSAAALPLGGAVRALGRPGALSGHVRTPQRVKSRYVLPQPGSSIVTSTPP
jgi:hypothetical protein